MADYRDAAKAASSPLNNLCRRLKPPFDEFLRGPTLLGAGLDGGRRLTAWSAGKRSLMTKFAAVLLVAVLGWSCACVDETCTPQDTNEMEYLVFWGPYPGGAPDQFDRIGPLAA